MWITININVQPNTRKEARTIINAITGTYTIICGCSGWTGNCGLKRDGQKSRRKTIVASNYGSRQLTGGQSYGEYGIANWLSTSNTIRNRIKIRWNQWYLWYQRYSR